jgi:hypothetical protein
MQVSRVIKTVKIENYFCFNKYVISSCFYSKCRYLQYQQVDKQIQNTKYSHQQIYALLFSFSDRIIQFRHHLRRLIYIPHTKSHRAHTSRENEHITPAPHTRVSAGQCGDDDGSEDARHGPSGVVNGVKERGVARGHLQIRAGHAADDGSVEELHTPINTINTNSIHQIISRCDSPARRS